MANIASARGPFAALRYAIDASFQRAEQRRKWNQVYLKTKAELDQLTDRELADIGYSRSDIPDIAHAAAEESCTR